MVVEQGLTVAQKTPVQRSDLGKCRNRTKKLSDKHRQEIPQRRTWKIFKLKHISTVGGTFKISIKSDGRIDEHANCKAESGTADHGGVKAIMTQTTHKDRSA